MKIWFKTILCDLDSLISMICRVILKIQLIKYYKCNNQYLKGIICFVFDLDINKKASYQNLQVIN